MSIPSFNVVKYVDANGVASSAVRRKLQNGLDVVLVKKDNLPKDKAVMMTMDTFVHKELPRVKAQVVVLSNPTRLMEINPDDSFLTRINKVIHNAGATMLNPLAMIEFHKSLWNPSDDAKRYAG